MSEWWRHLPERLDPVVFSIGSLPVRWYAVCFLAGFFVSVGYLLFRSRGKGAAFGIGTVWDASVAMFLGALLGGRLGYALFYDPSLFSVPIRLVFPVDPGTGTFSGIHGMSFFGALIGSGVVFLAFARAYRIDPVPFADFLVSGVPIALFLGRIGNFLNLELPGRKTAVPWGMYFPDPATGAWELRHPSQLYEALLEGMFLFVILTVLRKRGARDGILVAVFLSGYAVLRFFVEFFREPDPGSPVLFGWMTAGQMLSFTLFLIVVIGSAVFPDFFRRKRIDGEE